MLSLLRMRVVHKSLHRYHRMAPKTIVSTYLSSDAKQPPAPSPAVVATRVDPKVVAKIKSSFTYDDSVKSVKFITPLRAMREYILTTQDLEALPRYYSRSPYSGETQTQVFLRSDVEQLAYKKHGGKDAFELRLKIIKDMERRARADIFNLKKALKHFKATIESNRNDPSRHMERQRSVFRTGPGRVVLFAIAVNSLNVAAKAIAWWYTGSKSIFSEVMHSIADTFNQILVAYGLHSSFQKPDEMHPYGYIPMRNVSSLISGVAIFFLGAGFTFYHGVRGLLEPHDVEPLYWALLVLLGSFVSEGSTLALAYREARRGAKRHNYDSVRQWLMAGVDPSTSVVLLEDLAAVLGVLVAGTAMSITALTGSSLPDAVGAIGVSGILGAVAALIIRTNTEMLIGRSIPLEKQEAIMRLIDNMKVIRGTYDIKATMMGGDAMRFKAEVDIDGRELTKRYMETLPLDALLQEVKSIQTEQQLVHFMLKHGDNLVNTLGAEINQIEAKIKAAVEEKYRRLRIQYVIPERRLGLCLPAEIGLDFLPYFFYSITTFVVLSAFDRFLSFQTTERISRDDAH
ncbi:Zinc transporter 9, variant 2 [Clonorchis sinensis]|uniref:Proton-coupled zinc antiporter SLC30A9, mitochondrial n=1 Tax=Clonorchis sinensis TaxID=79923 RepID=A0A8T1MVD0_CLOSI|nr:Zinc transporter 9, variant 2 [Clonorchis sinensis]